MPVLWETPNGRKKFLASRDEMKEALISMKEKNDPNWVFYHMMFHVVDKLAGIEYELEQMNKRAENKQEGQVFLNEETGLIWKEALVVDHYEVFDKEGNKVMEVAKDGRVLSTNSQNSK